MLAAYLSFDWVSRYELVKSLQFKEAFMLKNYEETLFES